MKDKPLKVLWYLIEHSPRVVAVREVIKELWEEGEVQDQVLTEAIHELRRSLGDKGNDVGKPYAEPLPAVQALKPTSNGSFNEVNILPQEPGGGLTHGSCSLSEATSLRLAPHPCIPYASIGCLDPTLTSRQRATVAQW